MIVGVIVLRLISLRFIAVSSLLLLLVVTAAGQNSSSTEVVRLLPKTVGDFRAQSARPVFRKDDGDPGVPDVLGGAEGVYLSPKGERLTVIVIGTRSHGGAYSLLTVATGKMRSESKSPLKKLSDVGVAGFAVSDRVVFYKGSILVVVEGQSKSTGDAENSLVTFARSYANTLPHAENEIPVLVKHLPDWERAQDRAAYSVSLDSLQRAVGDEAVLDVISFEEGAEAVTASYDASRLVIVEYTTPQIAESNDARIKERIETLRGSGQSVPSAYRRVGNYSVFVFHAPDEAAATQLIESVKYEQRIQWLGENPFLYEAAQQHHTQQAVSLILGIAKAIGFFIALVLGAGGIVGGIAYLRHRTQQRTAADIYSDAGGMLRLNLDEMTPKPDPARLLRSDDGENAVRP